jgi:tetratricopeptide (TPR) repeat protein
MRFRKTLTLLMLAMGLIFALSAWAQQKPLTEDQVQSLVRSGLGDESGAKLIEQRGIDFAPAEDFLQSLKAAGASEAFLKALRAAKRPEPASAKKPLNQVQIFALLAGQVTSPRVAMLVKERGIDFEPQQDYLDEVRLGGGDDALITALKSAKVTKPTTVDPAAQARQAEVRQHLARGAELKQKGEYALAEEEYRAALLLDSQNADLYESLSYVLIQQEKWDDGTSAARQAVRLNPNNDLAHSYLGSALGNKGDWDGEIAEEREALRLNPKNEDAHVKLGIAIGNKGDVDGAMAEFREAVRVDPTDDLPHYNLGVALGGKGDRDGEIAEEREALRLNPKNELAHLSLGNALEKKGDLDGAVAEYRAGLRLNPNNDLAHSNLGIALGSKGDWDVAIAEEREALRLNPKNEDAHVTLGVALGHKGDLDGEIAEEREALRLNPNDDLAHANLGSALKSTGKPRVFIESWFAGGVFKAAREPDTTTEMAAFARSCPQSTVTIDDQSPDYTLKLSHVNDPRFHDGLSQIVNNQLHLIYGYTLFDHQGNMVSSQPVGASLTDAAQGACKAVLSNWSAR